MFVANKDFGVGFAKQHRMEEIEYVQTGHSTRSLRRTRRRRSRFGRGFHVLAAARAAAGAVTANLPSGAGLRRRPTVEGKAATIRPQDLGQH
jgi:hypothetical protein